ncbi:MAG: bifunctional phosphopantothenoylcysteine decarboxylase/phosphopantothenate--cysteine ligase CoaBC, partial [Marinilabiliales bacterium]
MAEPEVITKGIIEYFSSKKKLKTKRILVTAGPTFEPIDPVRFIGNYSSGKMGYAIASELADQGAEVVLISGPTHLEINNDLIHKINVQTAEEMFNMAVQQFERCDAAIMSAAVADFKPVMQHNEKVKRGKEEWQIMLEPNKDIAAELGKVKKKNQILVGFALETNNELENAMKKIQKKNLDFIVLNSLQEEGAGFGHDTNKISIINKHNNITKFELKSKKEVAFDIVQELIGWF